MLSSPAPLHGTLWGRRVGFKATQQHRGLAWPSWCRISVGKGLNPAEAQFPQTQKGDMSRTYLIRLMGGWIHTYVKSQRTSSLFPTCWHFSPYRILSLLKAQFKCHLLGELYPDPPLTSLVICASHAAHHLFCPGLLWVLGSNTLYF